jgi:hypothetical protein
MGMSVIIPHLEFLIVLVSFFILILNAISCPLDLLLVSFRVMVKVKGVSLF